MYTPFAYSAQMQQILMGIAFVKTFITMYLIAKLIEDVYFARFSARQKALFAFLTGTVLNDLWVYGLYYIGGMAGFSPLVYLLVTSTNPVFALLYNYIGIKVLNLPQRHASRLMGHAYLFYVITKVLNRFIGALWFTQQPGAYNYMLDAAQQIACLAATAALCFCVTHGLRRVGFSASLADQMRDDPKRDLLLYMLKATFIYASVTAVPLLVANQVMASALLEIICVLLLLLGVQIDVKDALAVRLENKDAHGNALRNTIEEFSTIEHSFYTILQGYQRHLARDDLEGLKRYHDALMDRTVRADGEMQLSRHMEENPALVSLLINKAEAAKRADLQLQMDIQVGLAGLPMESMDLCRVVACLLDNAIEAALESDQRRVHFSIEHKPGGARLIILTNSTKAPVDVNAIERPGVSSKPGHMGLGLPSVRKTLAKYTNCTLHTSYYDGGFSVYLALNP